MLCGLPKPESASDLSFEYPPVKLPECNQPGSVRGPMYILTSLQKLRLSVLSLLTCGVFLLISSPGFAGGHVRLSDGQNEYEGKVLALSQSRCSLLDKQGKLVHLNVKSLKSFEKVSSRYQPHSTSTFRQELRKEFPGYEIVGSTRYLVCGPRGSASKYSKLFDSIYRDVEQFYRVRGFRVVTPEVPLVAIVFGSQQEFVQYCMRDNVTPSSTLMGYYSLVSNRVALFDEGNSVASTIDFPTTSNNRYSNILAAAGIAGDTANTIIHETTHQVGYNIGVHSRLGNTPIWLVEGLATALEPNGMRSTRGRNLLSDRLNSERANWFARRHRPTRIAGNLALLVASDEYFHRQVLNSYSESWAFTFFLLETPAKRQQLVKYLQTLANRDAAKPYSGRERLKDFQAAFGDISRLEVEFLRYMDRL